MQKLLGCIVDAENWLLRKGMHYPWGLSLIGIVAKPTTKSLQR
jgi:uncharacterized membrane protein